MLPCKYRTPCPNAARRIILHDSLLFVHCLAQPKMLHLPRPCKRHAHKEERVQSRPIGLADSASAPRSGAYVCFSLPPAYPCPSFRRSICVSTQPLFDLCLAETSGGAPLGCPRAAKDTWPLLPCVLSLSPPGSTALGLQHQPQAAVVPQGGQAGLKGEQKQVFCVACRTSSSFVQGAGIMP
jgi:hypothetical protein